MEAGPTKKNRLLGDENEKTITIVACLHFLHFPTFQGPSSKVKKLHTDGEKYPQGNPVNSPGYRSGDRSSSASMVRQVSTLSPRPFKRRHKRSCWSRNPADLVGPKLRKFGIVSQKNRCNMYIKIYMCIFDPTGIIKKVTIFEVRRGSINLIFQNVWVNFDGFPTKSMV